MKALLVVSKPKKVPPPELPAYIVVFDTGCAVIRKFYMVNHQRLMQMSILLDAVVRKADLSDEFWLEKMDSDGNALNRLLYSMLHNELSLSVEPCRILNTRGDVSVLYKKLPLITKLISVGRKPKIVQACFYLLCQLMHIVKERPDIMKQLMFMGPYTNEVMIEYHNSTISRRVHGLEVLFQNIRNESINSCKIREAYSQLRDMLELE